MVERGSHVSMLREAVLHEDKREHMVKTGEWAEVSEISL
jgi:hypothetical protein